MRVLVIADTQCPGMHPDYPAFLKDVVNRHGPVDRVVHIGDEADHHHFGLFTKDPDYLGPKGELIAARAQLAQLYKLFPKVSVCVSNHQQRLYKRLFECGIPSELWPKYRDVVQAPETWEWEDEWVIDDVLYVHGDGYSGKGATFNMMLEKRMSVVHGHLHSGAGITSHNNGSSIVFGMNVGCGLDPTHSLFRYGKYSRNKVMLGCGIVTDGIPTFIPMILDKNNRWVGSRKKK